MTWVFYNDREIILEQDETLVGSWERFGYKLHGQSADDAVVSRFVDEINAM